MLPQPSKAASHKQMTCSRSKPRERQEQPKDACSFQIFIENYIVSISIRVLEKCTYSCNQNYTTIANQVYWRNVKKV